MYRNQTSDQDQACHVLFALGSILQPARSFRECVSINQRHKHGLILYGVVCNMQERHDKAETFFEAPTSFEPKCIQAWTMLGLFYDGIGNEIGTEMALLEANKLNVAAAIATAKEARAGKEAERQKQELSETPGDILVDGEEKREEIGVQTGAEDSANRGRSTENISRPGSQSRSNSVSHNHQQMGGEAGFEYSVPEATPAPENSIFIQIVEFLLEVKAMSFAERTLAHHLLDPLGGPSAKYYICLARLKLQKQCMEEAEEALKEALQFDHQHPDAWALMGHVKYMLGETEIAKDCYERTINFVTDAYEMHSIYLRLASIYLQESKFWDSRNTFLLACKKSPSCVSWLGVGIACYRLGELSEAEDALAEANILNNYDPEVWAYLSLVCLRTGRQLEAEQAYKYAIKLNIQDTTLMEEVHALQEEVGFGNPQL